MWSALYPISNHSHIRQLQFATHAFSQQVLQQAVQISICQCQILNLTYQKTLEALYNYPDSSCCLIHHDPCNVHAYANPGLQRIILYCKTDLSICSNKYTRRSTIFNHACTIYTLP